ncbi:MAG: FG-GAP repeat protein, partial [Nitrospirae bacterium]|nr:FG-GAP repeat protein [Nitrospirota bacterium]
SPQGVAVDNAGNIYVADTGNHRIQKFDASGKFISNWSASGVGDNGTILQSDNTTSPKTTPAKNDFDGDGKSDILWQNSKTGDVDIWLMNGKIINGGGFAVNGLPSDWVIKGIGDFNGDGKADVLLQNSNGDVYIWLMNGTKIVSSDYAQRGMPKEWVIRGVGDFNGDGKADILWQNTRW